ncbi:MAG TPA: alpha/beta hydrolase [Gemmatimonadaceae bacterium]|nr:alpha/beta hydrolase [Gemmatimonadaceae bacterium]
MPSTLGATLIDADLLRVPVGPGAMHVARYGHGGRPVLLVHGLGTSAFLWRNVAPALAVENHTAFAVDLFGHGESDRPYDGEFGISAQSEYLDRLLTALRAPKALVVGCDLGALVGVRLANDHPDRVERLVLVSPPDVTDLPGEDVKLLQRAVRRSPLRQQRGVMGAAPILRPLLEASVADESAMPEALVARYLAPFVGRDGVEQLLTVMRSIRAQELHEEELRTIAAPSMIVAGERDQWLPMDVAERLAAAIGDCRLERIPGVGRLIPEEAADELAELIIAFSEGR